MKKYLILTASGLFLLSGCVRNDIDNVQVRRGEIRFVAAMQQNDQTRATFKGDAETGTSAATWSADDMVGIFAVDASGATVSKNVAYKAVAGGSVAELVPVGSDEVAKADKYYAYFGYQSSNSSDGTPTACGYNLSATTVAGSVVGNIVRSTEADNCNHHLFYGEGTVSGKTVSMEFKSAFSVLEIGLRGSSKLTSVRIDLPESATGCMASTGTVDLTTGAITRSGSGERYLVADFTQLTEGYLQLGTTATRVQFAVDDFTTTEGLNLTFTNDAGETFTKTIWASLGEQRSFTAEGAPNHIYQPLAAVTDFDFSGDYRNINLRADMLSADNPQQGDGSLDWLVDGDPNTHYHAQWEEPTTPCPHYVVVKLDNPIHGLHIDITNRLRNGVDSDINVRNLNVYVGTDTFDGTNYDVAAEGVKRVLALADLPNQSGITHSLPDFYYENMTFNTVYLEVASTWGSSLFFAWGELAFKERLSAVPFENYDAPDPEVFEKVAIDGSKVWLDCYEESEGAPSNLVDGDKNTIIHFPWYNQQPWPHYIVMELDQPLSGFMFAYAGRDRSDPNNHARNMSVYVSKKFDGKFDTSKATFVGNYYNLPNYVDSQPVFNSKPYRNEDDSFKYVWFEINDSWGTSPFCAMAEMEIYQYKGDEVGPSLGFMNLYAEPLDSQNYNATKIEGAQAVWASSEELEGEGENNGAFKFAFDGNYDTFYHGNWYDEVALPHYLVYDLGVEVTEPLMINLFPRAGRSGDFPKNFNIYVSSTNIYDGTGYSFTDDLQLIAEVTNCPKPEGDGQVVLGAYDHSVAARYVMIELTATASGNNFTALGEIETFKAVEKVYTKTLIEGVKAVWCNSEASEEEEGDNGRIVSAFDGDVQTYYHGTWENPVDFPTYIVFDLGRDVTEPLWFKIFPRYNNPKDFPKDMKIYASASTFYNGESMTKPDDAVQLADVVGCAKPAGDGFAEFGVYGHSAAVRYVMLEVTASASGEGSFVAIGEIESYSCTEQE